MSIRYLLSFLCIFLFFALPSCHVVRYITWNFADIKDGQRFSSLPVQTGEHIKNLISVNGNHHFQVPEKYNPKSIWDDFNVFLEKHQTVAFLVLRNDSVLYENYFLGYDDQSLIPSFSVSKVFVSALTGIAIEEGFLCSPEQPITFFLEGMRPGFDLITIEHLLNMRSGIRFQESYWNPFAGMPKYYYGTNLKKYEKKLRIKQPPDQEYNYVSVNTLLLGRVIEEATAMKLSSYLQTRIWQPLGMESDATWNIDHPDHKTIKSFCCINAIARDYARFGRLYLNKGRWDDRQIVPEEWVDISTSIVNESRDSQGYPYTYHWRVLESGAYFAKGILGQYIYVFPDKNLVFVRLGKKHGGIDWADFFGELSEQL